MLLNMTERLASNPSIRSDMKKLITVILLGATLIPAQAQLFSREAFGGAALGGIVGGIIGHNNGRKTAEGIGIGAGAGLLLGAVTHQSRREYEYYPGPTYGYAYEAPRPNYAVTGTILGGIAGGVIGHNSGRRTAEGIAIGAGAGLLLGSVAEADRRRTVSYVQPIVSYAQPVPAYVAAAPAPLVEPQTAAVPPQQTTTANQSYVPSSAMSGANSLFGR
jgi:uncharacterized protein YcfJ